LDQDTIYDFPQSGGNEDGLVAIGGNLSPGTLFNAYSKGIFPWYTIDETVYWFSPDPRLVLFPRKIKISHSMKNVLHKNTFQFTADKAFEEVIKKCRTIKRGAEERTWISDDIQNAYIRLFNCGLAHSAEAWQNNRLVGGLYGVLLGKVFFGESMFAEKSNASKFALIKWTEELMRQGVQLIDCQVYTKHLESMGAEFVSGAEFKLMLKKFIW
jgi:leucyl/phenylalanyl-tRNA--protein transferase